MLKKILTQKVRKADIIVFQSLWVILLTLFAISSVEKTSGIQSKIFLASCILYLLLTAGIALHNRLAWKLNLIPPMLMIVLFFVEFYLNMTMIFPDSPGTIIVFLIFSVPFMLMPSIFLLIFHWHNKHLIFFNSLSSTSQRQSAN